MSSTMACRYSGHLAFVLYTYLAKQAPRYKVLGLRLFAQRRRNIKYKPVRRLQPLHLFQSLKTLGEKSPTGSSRKVLIGHAVRSLSCYSSGAIDSVICVRLCTRVPADIDATSRRRTRESVSRLRGTRPAS